MKRRIVAVIAVALAACSTSSGPTADEGAQVVIDGHKIVSHGEIDVGGQTAEDVRAESFFFDPTVLSGSGGQTITLTIDNSTATLHNFSLPEQQIDQDMGPGQKVQVSVRFPASGELTFFCKYHRSRGMLGALKAG